MRKWCIFLELVLGQVLAEMLVDIKNICFSTMLCARLMQCNVSVAFVHYFIDQYLSSASPRIKTDFFKQIKRDAKRSFFCSALLIIIWDWLRAGIGRIF